MGKISVLPNVVRTVALTAVVCGATPLALAGLTPDSVTTDLGYDVAMETHSNDVSLSRVTLQPQAKWRFGKGWRGEISLRMEWADDKTGLGTTSNYSSISQPWVKARRARIELDKAKLSWRSRGNRITLGKQVAAWGVLDGIRITDRFDPVRRRDFIFTDTRPERIARWGLQTQTQVNGWHLDTAIALDPTVSQQANIGDRFALQATRFTHGLSLEGSHGHLETEPRNRTVEDATIGFRLGRDLGAGRLSVMAFNGPTTDPILALDHIGTTPRVTLQYPKRSLVGVSWDRTLGSMVLRAEVAYIPDQPINVISESQLTHTRRSRWLGGLGVDWNAPLGIFVNAQIGADLIASGRADLARPQTDVIATLRVQRHFSQAGWKLQCEWIGSISDGDSVARPMIIRELTDSLTFTLGADLAFGDSSGQFGQFHERSRGWARIKVSW